jgi:hypothetical protein
MRTARTILRADGPWRVRAAAASKRRGADSRRPVFSRLSRSRRAASAVRRNIVYGDAPRNTLDLYLPDAPPKARSAAHASCFVPSF